MKAEEQQVKADLELDEDGKPTILHVIHCPLCWHKL